MDVNATDLVATTIDIDVYATRFTNQIFPEYTSSGGQNQIIYRNAESRSVSRGISLGITQNFDFPLTFSLGGTLQDVFVTEPNGSKRDSVKNLFNYTQTDPIIDAQNPFGDTFDTSYVYGPILGRRIMVGIRSRSIRSSQDW